MKGMVNTFLHRLRIPHLESRHVGRAVCVLQRSECCFNFFGADLLVLIVEETTTRFGFDD